MIYVLPVLKFENLILTTHFADIFSLILTQQIAFFFVKNNRLVFVMRLVSS